MNRHRELQPTQEPAQYEVQEMGVPINWNWEAPVNSRYADDEDDGYTD